MGLFDICKDYTVGEAQSSFPSPPLHMPCDLGLAFLSRSCEKETRTVNVLPTRQRICLCKEHSAVPA